MASKSTDKEPNSKEMLNSYTKKNGPRNISSQQDTASFREPIKLHNPFESAHKALIRPAADSKKNSKPIYSKKMNRYEEDGTSETEVKMATREIEKQYRPYV